METGKPSSVFPYLRSCEEESDKAIEGQVTGTVPSWLKGNLIRVGCGKTEVGPDRYNSLSDGLALMHRFGFAEGRVTYQSKFLRSDTYKKNMKANRIVVSEFSTPGCPDPCKTIFQRFISLFSLDELTDNDLVNVIMFGDEAYASSETNCIWKIDPETLESLEKVKLSTILPVNAAIAHPHEDADGTVYNMGSTYGMNCSYKILQFLSKAANKTSNALEGGRVICTIPSSKLMNGSYYHSFAMTENYFVFVEQPLYFSIPRIIYAHFWAGAYADAMSWDQDASTRFHVIKRSNNQLLDTKFVAKSLFVFHHINAYEVDNHLIVDLCGYDNGDIMNSMYFKALEDMFYNRNKGSEPILSSSRRYVLNLATGPSKTADKNLINLPKTKATAYYQADGSIYCNAEILTGSEQWSLELPRINYEKFNGKNYRYFYALGRQGTLDRSHLVKVDVVNKTCINWSEEGAIPSEPVYIADPNAENPGEDAGIILASLLYRSDEKKVSLLVLDARSMKEISRTTFITKSSVPADFHGTFVPKK
ncbi:hypothetical protein JTE90_001507 [Oedothorax gibbosus]|uniref:Uncharacterized protein n=1 Tax=Oedothorax gibbosus TaxID=931172 RepID=A0AAV6UKY7_9ARAC|nr:hypothetical protein JTE90_001507 [Oedothorax gibbosus]